MHLYPSTICLKNSKALSSGIALFDLIKSLRLDGQCSMTMYVKSLFLTTSQFLTTFGWSTTWRAFNQFSRRYRVTSLLMELILIALMATTFPLNESTPEQIFPLPLQTEPVAPFPIRSLVLQTKFFTFTTDIDSSFLKIKYIIDVIISTMENQEREIAIQQINTCKACFRNGKSKQEFEIAAKGYRAGIKCLTNAMANETNKQVKAEIMSKIPILEKEYIAMLEKLKKDFPSEAPNPPVEPKGNQNNELNKDQQKAKNSISDAIVKEKPNVKWEDVAGLEQAKKCLKQAVILPIKFPQIFVGQRTPWKGILLYGPPGTGKTYLAKACATAMEGGTFFSVSSADLMSKFVGESEKLIKTLFKTAREEKPSIIFIDEVDSMAGNRSDQQNEVSRRVKTQFLVQMQGVGNDATGVLVLGATNLPWSLDPAIRRRFQRRVYIPLPDFRARLRLLTHLTNSNRNTLTQEEIEDLANRSEMYSGSDINVLVRDASFEPLRFCQIATRFVSYTSGGVEKWMPCEAHENIQGRKYKNCGMRDITSGELKLPDLNYSHFLSALKKSKASVSVGDLSQYQQWTKQFGQDG